jgi:hypothetical protein
VPWLQDYSWGISFNWGFENYRTLVLNPKIYDFDQTTIGSFLVGIQDEAQSKLVDFRKILS